MPARFTRKHEACGLIQWPEHCWAEITRSSEAFPWRPMALWHGKYSTGPTGILCPSRWEVRQDTEDVANGACVEATEVTMYWVFCMRDFLMWIMLPYYQPTSNCTEQFHQLTQSYSEITYLIASWMTVNTKLCTSQVLCCHFPLWIFIPAQNLLYSSILHL